MNTATRVLASALTALSLSAVAAQADAQSGADEAVRSNLIDQALEARRTGNHAHALELADRANQIRMTGTLQGFMAREHLELGHLSDALGATELCVRDGENEPASRARDTILNWCRAQLPVLRTRVGRVVVAPAARPAGLHVTVGGHELSNAVLDVPYIVTPGAVVVDAYAPGFRAFHREVQVAAGSSVRVDVALEPEPGRVANGGTPGGEDGAPGGESHVTPPPGPPNNGGAATSHTVISPVGPVILAVGAAGMITAAITWVIGDGNLAAGMRACTMGCPADAPQMASSIETLDTITNIGLFGGGALVVLGGVLTFALIRTERAPEPARPAVSFTISPRSLGVMGTF